MGSGRADAWPMPKGKGRFRSGERGQTLTEFALILPVFLMLTLAVVDGARVYMAQISLTNGVREATLFATRGSYNAWCRDPNDPASADPTMPQTVPCPAGASSAHYGADPGNLAFRIAIETQGMNRSRITLATPLCGMGPSAPSASCAAVANPTYVTIKATYQFDMLTPLLAQLWGSSIVLQASSTGSLQ
jgi:hypothetical protein